MQWKAQTTEEYCLQTKEKGIAGESNKWNMKLNHEIEGNGNGRLKYELRSPIWQRNHVQVECQINRISFWWARSASRLWFAGIDQDRPCSERPWWLPSSKKSLLFSSSFTHHFHFISFFFILEKLAKLTETNECWNCTQKYWLQFEWPSKYQLEKKKVKQSWSTMVRGGNRDETMMMAEVVFLADHLW